MGCGNGGRVDKRRRQVVGGRWSVVSSGFVVVVYTLSGGLV